MKLQKVYHMGIPVDNLERAKEFYTNVLGMEYLGRVGGNPNNPDFSRVQFFRPSAVVYRFRFF
jgi:catechol 2,3-dioxygenase-like lactoylglutathione lyase family enzyme